MCRQHPTIKFDFSRERWKILLTIADKKQREGKEENANYISTQQ